MARAGEVNDDAIVRRFVASARVIERKRSACDTHDPRPRRAQRIATEDHAHAGYSTKRSCGGSSRTARVWAAAWSSGSRATITSRSTAIPVVRCAQRRVLAVSRPALHRRRRSFAGTNSGARAQCRQVASGSRAQGIDASDVTPDTPGRRGSRIASPTSSTASTPETL